MTRLLFALAAVACTEDAPSPSAHNAEHHATDARPQAEPPSSAPAAHHGSDHMAHMAEVREALKASLGPAYDAAPAHLEHADSGKGQATFARLCTSCHGVGGKGDGPAAAALDPRPADLSDPAHARYYSDAGRMEIIRNGVPVGQTAMVGFSGQLSEAEILDLYAWVASLRGEPPAESSGHEHAGHETH